MSFTKDHIIKEIQRTARLNGSKPLGTAKFRQETGIKVADWYGKYWSKWGDAVTEAGFTPNVLQGAIANDELLTAYIELASELGHVPTNAELRLKAKADTTFPSHNTFAKFGSKKQLARQCLDFCAVSKKYEGLARLFETIGKSEEEGALIKTKLSEPPIGYVYLLFFGNEYKIGSSNNVERRFREIKTQMPYEGKIVHSIETGDPNGIEAYWHGYFKDRRLKGEWFKLTHSDIAYFKRRKLM